MPKSKYPNKLDSSIELPPVRDNILEVGSDVINSLRSAIFQIERTLGINPQGAVGNTVATRIDRALDSNGNIKADALSRSNVLSGPILDADVSSAAAIHESKLKLDFPTTLLQDEISIINGQLDNIISQIEELSINLSLHLNPNATGRHGAISISVNESTSIGTDESAIDLQSGTLQAALETIYNSHINYTGANITADNNSHQAAQIFFDNTNVSGLLSANDVQEAIEDLSLTTQDSSVEHQDLFHSNGMLGFNKIDTAINPGVGEILAENIDLSFSKSTGLSSGIATVVLSSSIPLGNFNLEKSDILTISDSSDVDEVFVGEYEIESYQTDGFDNITSINVFSYFKSDSTALTQGRISKNINQLANPLALIGSLREEAILTSAKTLQICNPDSVNVISSQIRTSEITSSNRFIDISIDGGTAVSLDLFDGTATRQSVDTIVSVINEQSAENHYDFLAYKVNLKTGGTELGIAHNLPDTSTEQHTITISRGSDGGIDAAGFSDIEDIPVTSKFGSRYVISGIPYTGLKLKIDSSDITFSAGSVIINSGNEDFLELGIKSQDIVVITDAPTSGDNGTFVIDSVSKTQIALTSDQLPLGFSSNSDEDTRIRVYQNIVSFDNITFDEVSSTFGATLLDVFMDQDRDIFISKRFEYAAQFSGTNSLVTLVDFEGDIADKTLSLNITGDSSDLITLTLDEGDPVEVNSVDNYVWIVSGIYNIRLKLYIPDVSAVYNAILTDPPDLNFEFYGYKGVNEDTNLIISRVTYDNFIGRVSLSNEKFRTGTIGISEIGSDAIRKLREVPIDELRSNGIISGFEVTNASIDGNNLYVFDVSKGICYIGGRRFELPAKTVITTDIDSGLYDKVFIAIDDNGNIVFENTTPTCESPFSDSNNVILAVLEFSATVSIVDLRLFINDLDLKVLNSITVSPQHGMGHFTDLGKAIKYAKRFKEIYPNAGAPTIHLKSGLHENIIEFDESGMTEAEWITNVASLSKNYIPTSEIDEYINKGLFVDFPVNIVGEGNSTVVRNISRYTFSDITRDYRGFIGVPGNDFTGHTAPLDKITGGFLYFKNLQMRDTRIDLHGITVTDGSSNFGMGIFIEDVIFDMETAFSNDRDDSFISTLGTPGIGLWIGDSLTYDRGGLYIDKCKFNECVIYLDVEDRLDPSGIRNINITNNLVIGSGIDWLISINAYGTDNLGLSPGHNINITGNHNIYNFTEDGPDIVGEGEVTAQGWGDRIDKSLKVGRDLFVEGALDVSGQLLALNTENVLHAKSITIYHNDSPINNIYYSPNKTRTQVYTFDKYDVNNAAAWQPTDTFVVQPQHVLYENTATDGTYKWPGILMDQIDSPFRFRLDGGNDERIKTVTLGVGLPSNDIVWSIKILKLSLRGGYGMGDAFDPPYPDSQGSGSASLAGGTTASSQGGSIVSLDISPEFDIGIDDADQYIYLMEVTNNALLGTEPDAVLFFAKVTYEVPSIESFMNITAP